MDDDDGETIWHVVYDDFDEEDLNRGQLTECLVYHPGLSTTDEVILPVVETYVWVAWDQHPWVGRVVAVDPSVSRPIQVRCYTPTKGLEDLTKERFLPAVEEDKPVIMQLSTHQVMLPVEKLTPRGYLPAHDRRRLAMMLRE